LRPSGDPAPALARASKAFGPSRTTSPIGMSLAAPGPPLAEAESPETTPAGGSNAPRGAPVRDRRKKNRWRYPSGRLPPG
jgi:hypothetical protein